MACVPHPWLHRVAVTTAVAALVPISVGALVTTMRWGMAFADWPTSDGHNMLTYPWLADWAQGFVDRFGEHGHRLAGVFIGCCSIALAGLAWRWDERRWVRWLGVAVLLSVIVQGLLGGNRVLRDDPRWALVHGAFAAVVFTLMAGMALVTGRRWRGDPGESKPDTEFVPDWSRPFVLAAPFLVAMQYLAGGFVRHLGTGLHEHLGGAALVAGALALSALAARRSPVPVIRSLGATLAIVLAFQLALGAGAWVTRFGFATLGYVAVHESPPQVAFRTAHAVVGMLVLAATALLAFSVLAWERSAGRPAPLGERSSLSVAAKGGA